MHPSPQSPLAPLTQERGWQQHADTLNAIWAGLDAHQLSKIRAWSQANLTARKPVTYYLFSGPDFLYADAFFPNASTYILAGLEPAGQIPDVLKLRPRSVAAELDEAQDLSRHLAEDELFHHERDGRGPQRQSSCAARCRCCTCSWRAPGKTIHEVSFVDLAPDGSLQSAGGRKERRARGQDRLLGQRRQAADALLLQDRPQQSRRPEQRLPAVLRTVRHRRHFHQGRILSPAQRGLFNCPRFPARPRRFDRPGRYGHSGERFPEGGMGASAVRPVRRADPHLQRQLSIEAQRPVSRRQSLRRSISALAIGGAPINRMCCWR